MLDAIGPLCAAGVALHWLHPKSKRPIGKDWSEKSVTNVELLKATYEIGNNVGVRLGEPSDLADGFLYAIDIDIRLPEVVEEAWAAFAKLFPSVARSDLPEVQSGSGGESRHLYFITDTPFRSKMLAHSEGKHRSPDGVWHYDYEIELFGTGKQVALPPSIHPDTGKPYQWVREFDFDGFEQPFIPASHIESLGAINTDTFEFELRDPLEFRPGQLEADLDLIPVSDLHYDDWIRLGQALHHQFGGSQEGFDLWLQHTRRSTKFTGDAQIREMRRIKWRSFGKYRGNPVTMGTVRAWANTERQASIMAELDDLPDDDLDADDDAEKVGNTSHSDSDFDDLIHDEPATPKSDDDVFSIGLGTPALDDWKTLLAYTEKGIVANLPNIELIMKNDPRLKGLCQRNEFTQETVQRIAPGHKSKSRANAAKDARQLVGPIWQVRDTLNGETWSNDRDCAVRSIIETPKTQGGYGIKVSDRDLKAATVLAARENGFHPIREYLEGVAWDGVERIDRLFVDYLGTEDNVYTRQVARLMMVAAVARVFEPGCKWDHAVILEGAQGVGKSTFIRILGRNWSVELDGNFHDAKSMVEKLQGGWIVELPELTGFAKSEVQDIKAFISRQFDKVRLAYEARAQAFPRQSILIGSTNSGEYLRDATGGRRFLPIECHVKAIDTARFRKDVDQYWAEAMSVYRSMHAELDSTESGLHLYLSGEALAHASGLQESRRVETAEDGLVGRIMCWLDTPVTSGSIDEDAVPQFRNVTCAQELFRALRVDDNTILLASVQRTIAMVPGWKKGEGVNARHIFPLPIGRQRHYERVGSPGRLQPVSPAAAAADAAA
ncbi:VapE domain-containing protein [Sphingomonas sp. R86521]|uniref:VapE domain-containing protein n=1 Tax=Sphingomonas sp. R86521 TaxID=3093860 RepID=UPI0036D3437F